MARERQQSDPAGLPEEAQAFIRQVIRKMRYRKKVRADVQAELVAHFEDELKDCPDAEAREQKARQLVDEFGDARLLAALCRRAKKRCRPLWQKVLVRGGLTLGLLFLYLVLCTLPLFVGKPTIRVNYATWLSDRARPPEEDAENARQYYDRAGELYVDPPDALAGLGFPHGKIRDCNEVELTLLAAWLARNEPAFDMLRRGADTAHYWPRYDVNESGGGPGKGHPFWMDVEVLPQAMEPLTGYRHIALAMMDRIAYEIRQGAVDEAIDDSLAILRFGQHTEGKGFLVEQLVSVAIKECGCSAVYDVLQQGELPLEVLIRLQDELKTLFDKDQPIISLDGEKALWYDKIQRTFTDDGHGGGRALHHGVLFAAGDWMNNLAGILLFDYPDRREAMAAVEAYFEWAQESLRRPPRDINQLAEHDEDAEEVPASNLLLSIMAPAHERLAQMAWRTRTGEDALIATVAIFRYKAQKGSYPPSLEELVDANLLERLPDDPFGEGSLSYRRTADGFLVYSWGENLKDDGGRQGTGRDGKSRMYADNGDWVFWPLENGSE